jgi:hypothetical protein
MANNGLHRDLPDATDPVGPKLRRGVDWVEKALDDRWPARGRANQVDGEYRPLEDVSRGGRLEPYRKWPSR